MIIAHADDDASVDFQSRLDSVSFGFSDLRRGQNEAERTLCKTSQCPLITYGDSVASGFVGTRAALTKIALALAVRSSSARA